MADNGSVGDNGSAGQKKSGLSGLIPIIHWLPQY